MVLTAEEVTDRINELFGDQIATFEDGDIKLRYRKEVNGETVLLEDLIMCGDDLYPFFWYDTRSNLLCTRSYRGTEQTVYCINDNTKGDFAEIYEEFNEWYWEFDDEEELINIVNALHEFFGMNISVPLIMDDDMVI